MDYLWLFFAIRYITLKPRTCWSATLRKEYFEGYTNKRNRYNLLQWQIDVVFVVSELQVLLIDKLFIC